MRYKNAKKILPEHLLAELQKYVCGEIIYVPGNDRIKAAWGEANGTRDKYSARNNEIIMLYLGGASKGELADRYHLSEYSIKKILSRRRNKLSC